MPLRLAGNAFTAENGDTASSLGCTMDLTLVRESFDHFQKGPRGAGRDDEMLPVIAALEAKVFPTASGVRKDDGMVRDFDEPEPCHATCPTCKGVPGVLFRRRNADDACRKSIVRDRTRRAHRVELRVADQPVRGAGRRRMRLPAAAELLTRSHRPQSVGFVAAFPDRRNFAAQRDRKPCWRRIAAGSLVCCPRCPKAFANGSVKGLRITGIRAVDCAGASGSG